MLTQSEADVLISMKKKKTTDENYDFPSLEEYLVLPIVSIDEKESFLVDVNRKGTIKLTKCTYQERYKETIHLVRLDIDGKPHTNPRVSSVPVPYLDTHNGEMCSGTHLHLYIEGFDDRWAIPVPPDKFLKTDDLYETLYDFFSYCNIIDSPIVQRRLF